MSNKAFYECLVQANLNNIEVRVTHIGSVDEWLSDDGTAALEVQGTAIKAGRCKITRIFVGSLTPEQAFNDEKYRAVMKSMQRHKVVTGYVQRSDSRQVPDMTWLPDLGILMTWESMNGVGVRSLYVRAVDDSMNMSLGRKWSALQQDLRRPPS